MTVTLISLMTAMLMCAICCWQIRRSRKFKSMYDDEVEKNNGLMDELNRLEQMERVKNEARKESERKINEVDSLSGIDRFNAINAVLSNNS